MKLLTIAACMLLTCGSVFAEAEPLSCQYKQAAIRLKVLKVEVCLLGVQSRGTRRVSAVLQTLVNVGVEPLSALIRETDGRSGPFVALAGSEVIAGPRDSLPMDGGFVAPDVSIVRLLPGESHALRYEIGPALWRQPRPNEPISIFVQGAVDFYFDGEETDAVAVTLKRRSEEKAAGRLPPEAVFRKVYLKHPD